MLNFGTGYGPSAASLSSRSGQPVFFPACGQTASSSFIAWVFEPDAADLAEVFGQSGVKLNFVKELVGA